MSTTLPTGDGLTNWEQIAAFFLGGVSNFIFIVPAYLLYFKRLYFELVFILCVGVISFMYHTSDAFNQELLFLNMSEWNEIDDIFASSYGVCAVVLLLNHVHLKTRATSLAFAVSASASDPNHPYHLTPVTREINIIILGLTFAIAVVWNQIAPITSLSIAGPMCIGIALALVSVLRRQILITRVRAILSHHRSLIAFLLFGVAGGVFYFISQPRSEDYLRWKHACWHICIGAAVAAAVYMCEVYTANLPEYRMELHYSRPRIAINFGEIEPIPVRTILPLKANEFMTTTTTTLVQAQRGEFELLEVMYGAAMHYRSLT